MPKTPDVAIHSFVSPDAHETLKGIALRNKRSLSKQITWILERYLREREDRTS